MQLQNLTPFLDRAASRMARAQAIVSSAGDRDLNDDEQKEYRSLTDGAARDMDDAEKAQKFNARWEQFRQPTGPTGAKVPPQLETRSATPGARERAILIPSKTEYRAQAEGSDPAGGYLVPVEQSRVVVERLTPESVLLSAGPRLFTMASDELRVPKVASGVTAAMVAENAPITPSDVVFDAAQLVARKLAVYNVSSNEWLADGVPEPRLLLEQHAMREMAVELDRQFFVGNGTPPNLSGILDWSGVTSTPGTASLDDIAAAIARVEAAFARPNAIFVSPANWAALRIERDAGATGSYMLQPAAAEATRPQIFGVRVFVTPHVDTSIVVADMRYVAVGVRDRMSTLFDPYSHSANDQTAIRVTSRWAIAPLHEDAIQVIETTGESGALSADESPAGRKRR